jgi:hypothetical protein
MSYYGYCLCKASDTLCSAGRATAVSNHGKEVELSAAIRPAVP